MKKILLLAVLLLAPGFLMADSKQTTTCVCLTEDAKLESRTEADDPSCQCLAPVFGGVALESPKQMDEKVVFAMKRKCQNDVLHGLCGDYCTLFNESEAALTLCTHVSRTGEEKLSEEVQELFSIAAGCENMKSTYVLSQDQLHHCLENAKGMLEAIVAEIPGTVLGPLESEFKKESLSKSRFYESLVEEGARWAPEKIGCLDVTALRYKKSGLKSLAPGMYVKLTAGVCDLSSDEAYVVCEQKSLPRAADDDSYLPLRVLKESIPESLMKFLKQGTASEDFWVKLTNVSDSLEGIYQSRCRIAVYNTN